MSKGASELAENGGPRHRIDRCDGTHHVQCGPAEVTVVCRSRVHVRSVTKEGLKHWLVAQQDRSVKQRLKRIV